MSTINYTTNQGSNDPQEILHILNGNVKPKKQSITKSFRLDQDIINKINEQVKHSNNSLNAEINGILRKYIDWDMLASKVGMVPIAKPIVLEIFQNIMTKEQVIDLANNEARNVIRETVQFMKGNLTLESFLSWLKTRMELCSNVNYAMENNSQQIRMIFKHDLGENWSIYHKIVIEDILYEILGESINVGIDVSPTTLVLCFRKGEYR